jgi:hypothetical protein
MEEALKADGETLPAGSDSMPREPMDLAAKPAVGVASDSAGGASATTDVVSTGGAAVTIDPPLPGA